MTANSTGCSTSIRSRAGEPGVSAHGAEQRPVDELGECGIALLHLVGEGRRGVQQFDRRAHPLRSVAGNDEDGFHPWQQPVRSTHSAQACLRRLTPTHSTARRDRHRSPRPARWSNEAPVVASEYATSSGSNSVCWSTKLRNRAACSASADADFADNTQGITGGRWCAHLRERLTGPPSLLNGHWSTRGRSRVVRSSQNRRSRSVARTPVGRRHCTLGGLLRGTT